MIELWIDGERCDVEKLPVIPIDFDVEKLTNVEGARSGRTIELKLPVTPRNEAVFASSKDIYATSRFNSAHHTAVVKRNGVVIFEGTAYLRSTTIGEGDSGAYEIRISEGGAEWIEPLVYGKLSDLDIPFSGWLNLATISDSWREDGAVLFLPVRRGEKSAGYSSSALPIEWMMLSDDYHPFISIAQMVKAMFAKTGYRLRSDFFDSDFAKSLYMSGDYSRSDTSAAKAKCDFFARRSKPVEASADFAGRVYASTNFATHTVGPLVDTANPAAFDSEGVQMSETFNTHNAFSINEYGNLCFTPSRSVKAGFLLHLEYTSDYRILTRDKLKGFDTIEGIDGVFLQFPLANTFKDLRNEPSANWQYRAFVFDHVEGRSYKLMAQNEDGSTSNLGEWNTRSALIKTTSKKPSSVHLYYRDSESLMWESYTEDWALYAGYIEEEGRVEIKMDLRLPPQDVAAGESFCLDKIWFAGADPEMKLTLGIGTTLRPYFTTVPGYGSPILFEDIAPRHIRQIDLLDALGEMFNLAFYTDRVRKEVYIEPLEQLYNDDEVIDINDRIVATSAMQLSDTGLDMPQTHRFAYKDADSATRKFNNENGTTLGRWSYRNSLYGTKDSVRECGGKLFTPTVNVLNVVAFARSASLMQVGDIGEQELGIDAPFSPHIVCYKGVRPLPEDECWIAGNKLDYYPYAAFFDEEDINLCFEERNGIEGLGSYHLARLQRQEEGQRVTLDVAFTTAEMASLFTSYGCNLMALCTFRFDIRGESSRYRLAKIEDWDTASGVVRCTFERILKD